MIAFPNISPEIFSVTFFGIELALRWYALAYIVGILIGWWIVVRALRRDRLWPNDQAPLEPKKSEDLLTWIIIGVILGGRLGYVLFYQRAYYFENPGEILMVWQGGMSFHGGFLGVILAAWLFYRKHGVPLLQGSDLLAISVAPGLLLGRMANFINAELWGRPTDVPWGVAFPGEAAQACGQAIGALCARHPSQLYEAILEGLLLGAILLWLAFRRNGFKTPGCLFGIFLLGYGAARFVVEFWRQPDAHFVTPDNPLGLAYHIGGTGLTMGQVLSLPMILIGLYFLIRARRNG